MYVEIDIYVCVYIYIYQKLLVISVGLDVACP